jgi:hypothetical protein
MRTYTEPSRKIKVFDEVNVAIVGGGPGGVASAICAARNGAKTLLIERYGHLGGMATGGLINILPNLSDISGKQHIFGITQEIIDRVDARGGATYPAKKDWGSTDKKLVNFYLDANLGFFYVRKDPNRQDKLAVMYTAVIDPEILKDELNNMVLGSGAKLLLHSWGTRPIMEGNTVKGIFFESKSGRQAVLADIVIDATGDGDIFIEAGADFDPTLDIKRRTAWLASTFWITNVNLKKFEDFKATHTDKFKELMHELLALDGYPTFIKGTLKNQPGVVWYHSFQVQSHASDAKNVEELTRIDIRGRKRALVTYEFMRKNVPGFEKCYIMQTAPQLGIQGGRRVIGEYILSDKDLVSDEVFKDTIAVLANNDNGEISARHPALCIPYRCLVPKSVDGLLVACRAFSSTDSVNHHFNIIPPCLCYGQAAGTAAAMAVKSGIPPRKVDYKKLRRNLVKQGVNLP